ncbi:MAG: LCP family protein [Desulfitobacterium sp.]
MKRFWVGIILGLGIVAIIAGVYDWNRQTIHHPKVVYQPEVAPIENTAAGHEKVDMSPLPEAKGRVNFLALGIDNEGDEPGRADSIIVVSANLDSHQVSVISIPRDTRVSLSGVGLTKITHVNAVGEVRGGVHEGTMESVKAVGDLLGININYYAKANFCGFQKVVDALGGVQVNLPNAVNDASSNLHLSAGAHYLSGEEALVLAQARHDLPGGDFDRQQNQFYILRGLAGQLLKPSTISDLPQLLSVMREDLVDTNMSISEMVMLGLEFKGIDKETIKYYQLPGQGISAPDPLVGASVYYYEPNQEGIKKIVQEVLTR